MAANNSKSVKPFGISDKFGYMFGDFGNDFTFLLSSMFMMKFYTDVMGVTPAIVGMLMMIARFVDAVTDVTMGQIVDRSKPTKDGKFKPWIRRCCGPLGIAAFLIFQSGFAGMSMGFKIFWMFFTYLLWGSIFYTSVNIPYGSMASAVSPEADDRAQLSTWRTIGSSCANLVIGTCTPLFAYAVVDGATVLVGTRMTLIAGVFAACGVICHLLCFHLVTERVEIPQNTSKLDVGAMLKSIVTNRALLGIIAAAIMLLLGMLGMSGMAPYVFPVFYNNAGAQSLSSLLGSLASLLICLVIRPASAYAYVAFYTLASIGYGFFNFVIWAMITDVIDDAEVRNGVREDGTIYSVYSFARKVGQALSSGMIGGLMTMIGYSSAVASSPASYPEVLSNIFRVSCLVPAIGLLLVTAALVFIYPLNKARVDSNVAELKRRREGK